MSNSINIVIIVLALLGIFMIFTRKGSPAQRVNGEEARELVKSGAVLLDVRTPAEFSAGHIKGARNIPLQSLGSRVHELKQKDSPIVVYCRSGNRSASASKVLMGSGYEKVYDLGAMSRW